MKLFIHLCDIHLLCLNESAMGPNKLFVQTPQASLDPICISHCVIGGMSLQCGLTMLILHLNVP